MSAPMYRRMVDPATQWRGKVNKAQGAHFEQMISRSCEHYREVGIAVIEKTPEPFHVTRNLSGGKFQGNFAKTAQPDFKGVLRGGKMIAFEAKYSAADRIDQSRVTEEQTAALNSYEAAGALCFVFVSLKMQKFYFIPWPIWKNMKQLFGRKYMTGLETDLEAYEKRFNGRWIEFLREDK